MRTLPKCVVLQSQTPDKWSHIEEYFGMRTIPATVNTLHVNAIPERSKHLKNPEAMIRWRVGAASRSKMLVSPPPRNPTQANLFAGNNMPSMAKSIVMGALLTALISNSGLADCGIDQVNKLLDHGFSHDDIIKYCDQKAKPVQGPTSPTEASSAPPATAKSELTKAQRSMVGLTGWSGVMDGDALVITRTSEDRGYFYTSKRYKPDDIGHREISGEFRLHAKAVPDKITNVGLMFGMTDDNHFSVLAVGADKRVQVCHTEDGGGRFSCSTQTTLADDAIQNWTRLTVTDADHAIRMTYNNGSTVGVSVYDDQQYVNGSMGLFSFGGRDDGFAVRNLQYADLETK